MRRLPIWLGIISIVTTSGLARAQKPRHANWRAVEQLPPGTAIHVRTGKAKVACTLGSVDADSLTCANGGQTTFSRTEVRTVTVPRPRSHQVSSTLIGGAVFAAIGAVVGLFDTAAQNYWLPRQQREGLGWGALTGAATLDGTAALIEFWPRTETVYKAL